MSRPSVRVTWQPGPDAPKLPSRPVAPEPWQEPAWAATIRKENPLMGLSQLNMKPNPGMNPKAPPETFWTGRWRPYIDRTVREVGDSARGLNVGLNSWWRPVGAEGEELSQHLIGAAVDFQGPDQETLAKRLESRGWTVLRRSNAGVAYNHIHAQQEKAGLLVRLGVTKADLA